MVSGLNKPETELVGVEEDKDTKEAKPAVRCRDLFLWKLKREGSVCEVFVWVVMKTRK